jgi:hypothetical protein
VAKYRKKPIVIEAEVYRKGLEDGFKFYFTEYPEEGFTFVSKTELARRKAQGESIDIEIVSPAIITLKGWMEITHGDYIVTGIKGERYPVKPDIFHATYEKVED